MTDPIADMLIRIKNAGSVSKKDVNLPLSKLKLEILKILKKEGFISNFKEEKDKQEIIVELKYINDVPAISGTKRISKPGRRIYASSSNIKKTLNHLGIGIISTPKGILTDKEAKKQATGGEIICEVW